MHASLSYRCREIILGSLLGDGSLRINKLYVNARFSFRHSIHQEEYFRWKAKELAEIASDHHTWLQEPDGFGGAKLRFQSRALESLTDIYRLTNKHSTLRIRRAWLNQLTPLSLMVWWLDDGSIIANGRKGVLCTDGFPRDGVILLAQYLHKVWNITARVAPVGKTGKRATQYRLWLSSTEELKKFLRVILPHVPVASMLPKVILLYKDSQLQQRWISEVGKTTGFPRDIVEQYYHEKKSKWKHFRE